MPREKQKRRKLGRNDPCWCGSGKKYKDCHLPEEDARRNEQRKLRQAHDTLLPKIFDAAQQMTQAIPLALELFWHGKYTPEQMPELDDLEDRGAERFLTWFAFDYGLEDQQPLVTRLAQAQESPGEEHFEGFELDEFEARLLHTWTRVRLRPYVVLEVRKGKGFTLRDLLDEQVCVVEEHSASRRVLADEVLVGHLVPVGVDPASIGPPPEGSESEEAARAAEVPIYYVAGAMAQLTSDTREAVIEFARLHLEDLRRTRPDATLDDLLRQRSYIFNHFVMELPEEHDPNLLEDVLHKVRTNLHFAGVLPMNEQAAAEEPAEEPDEEPAEEPDDNSPAIKNES